MTNKKCLASCCECIFWSLAILLMFEIQKSDSPEPDLNQKVICACIIAWVATESDTECKCCAHSHARYHGPGCHLAHSKQVARRGILPEEKERETKKMLSRRWAKFLLQRGFAGEGHCFANVRTKESWINSGAKAHHSSAHKAEGAHLHTPPYYIRTLRLSLFLPRIRRT
jgi:hypothetical protein